MVAAEGGRGVLVLAIKRRCLTPTEVYSTTWNTYLRVRIMTEAMEWSGFRFRVQLASGIALPIMASCMKLHRSFSAVRVQHLRVVSWP